MSTHHRIVMLFTKQKLIYSFNGKHGQVGASVTL